MPKTLNGTVCCELALRKRILESGKENYRRIMHNVTTMNGESPAYFHAVSALILLMKTRRKALNCPSVFYQPDKISAIFILCKFFLQKNY